MSDRAAPEMRRPFSVARIGAGARSVVEATVDERAALAARMGVPAIHSLTCRFDLKRLPADAIEAQGLLCGRVQQVCVITLEAFDTEVTERFSLRFVPLGTEQADVDMESDDEVTYEGGTLDLGEAASEQLALALDPFPRMPGAELAAEAKDQDGDTFAALGRLLPRH